MLPRILQIIAQLKLDIRANNLSAKRYLEDLDKKYQNAFKELESTKSHTKYQYNKKISYLLKNLDKELEYRTQSNLQTSIRIAKQKQLTLILGKIRANIEIEKTKTYAVDLKSAQDCINCFRQ